MKILWIFLGLITILNYIEVSFLCILGLFLRSRYIKGIFFGVAKISIIFWGCLNYS